RLPALPPVSPDPVVRDPNVIPQQETYNARGFRRSTDMEAVAFESDGADAATEQILNQARTALGMLDAKTAREHLERASQGLRSARQTERLNSLRAISDYLAAFDELLVEGSARVFRGMQFAKPGVGPEAPTYAF